MIQQEDGKFKRKGADLICHHEISIHESLNDCIIQLPYIDGSKLQLQKSDKIIAPASIMTVIGKGMPLYKIPDKYGNLFIVFTIKFPKALSDVEKQSLLNEIAMPCKIPQGCITMQCIRTVDSHKNIHYEGGKEGKGNYEDNEKDERNGCGMQ